jgi:hypothetical protein
VLDDVDEPADRAGQVDRVPLAGDQERAAPAERGHFVRELGDGTAAEHHARRAEAERERPHPPILPLPLLRGGSGNPG